MTRAGTDDGSASKSGSRCRTFESVSDTSWSANARLPVSISYSTAPKAQMSARLSTVFPRACSGLMYAAVPRIIPACVMAGAVIVGDIDMSGDQLAAGSIAFASPKSSTFTVPSLGDLDVRGLQIPMDDPLFVRGFQGVRDLLRDRQGFIDRDGALRDPVREIVALNEFHHQRSTPPDSSRPCMCAMFGWFRDARTSASR